MNIASNNDVENYIKEVRERIQPELPYGSRKAKIKRLRRTIEEASCGGEEMTTAKLLEQFGSPEQFSKNMVGQKKKKVIPIKNKIKRLLIIAVVLVATVFVVAFAYNWISARTGRTEESVVIIGVSEIPETTKGADQ